MMIKWFIIFTLILASLTACINGNDEKHISKDEKEKKVSVSKKEESLGKHGEKNQGKLIEIKGKKEGLKYYRPTIGIKKTFMGADQFESFTEEFVYETNDYLQCIIRIGQSTSVIVYKWTDKEISIVSQIKDPQNPYKNYLNGINDPKNREILISQNTSPQTNWKLIQENETVKTPYQSFAGVTVIQKVTDEVKDADTIYTYYLAPKIGFVREIFKVTGEQGYSADSLLQKVE
jgi:hypothetical protein